MMEAEATPTNSLKSFPPPVRQIFRLSDEALAEIVRIVQLGFLTATNVVDHLRMIKLEPKTEEPTALVPTPEYLAWQEKNIKNLEEEAQKLIAEESGSTGDIANNSPSTGVKLN